MMATLAEHMNRTETQCFTKRLQCLTTKDDSSRENLSLGLFSLQLSGQGLDYARLPVSILDLFSIHFQHARKKQQSSATNTQRCERELLRLTLHSIPMHVEHCHDLREIPFDETKTSVKAMHRGKYSLRGDVNILGVRKRISRRDSTVRIDFGSIGCR